MADESIPNPALSDEAILANMKATAPWLWKMWNDPSMTPEQKATFIKWGRMSASGTPPTDKEIATDTYAWDTTQIWTANQAAKFELSFTNPGEYKSQLKKAQDEITRLITLNGLNPDQGAIDTAVNESFLQGWGSNDPRILETLVGKSNLNPSTALTGKAGVAQTDILGIADAYGIPLPKDPNQLQSFIKSALGSLGNQGFTQYAKDQAKILFPWMTSAIDAGVTPKDYLTPMMTNVAKTLGINSADIDTTAPKWQNLFTQVDKTGARVPASYGWIDKTVKTDSQYRYDYSPEGRKQGAEFASGFKSMFGN